MTSRELSNRSLIAKALTYVCAIGSINSYLQPCVSAVAKTDKSSSSAYSSDKKDKTRKKSSEKSSKHHKSSKHQKNAISTTGLDQTTLDLMNRGDWKAAAERLETLTAGRTEIGKEESWLAFSYMFLAKCDQLKALATKAGISEPVVEVTTKTDVSVSTSGESKPAADGKTVPAAEGKSLTTEKVVVAAVEPPRSSNIHVVLIKAYNEMCQQKLDLADKTLQNIPDQYANDPTVFFALAAIAGKQGRASSAVEYAQRAVELAPDFAWGYRTIGFLEQRFLKDTRKADAAFAQAFSIEPRMREAAEALIDLRLSTNNFDGALDIAQQVLADNPKDAANYYRVVQIYIQQWRLREALTELQEAISLDAKDPRFYRSRASIRRYQGDLTAAIADQTKAVEFSNDKAFELGELATMNLLAGNKNRAIDNLQESLKLDAKNQSVRDRLVALLTEEKRYEDLSTFYKQELATKQKDEKLHLGLANVLVLLGRSDQAVEEFKLAANLDPLDAEPHRSLGALRIKQKDYAAAAKEFTRALNINPTVQDLVALGYCYALNDEYVNAETALVTSLALQQLTQSTTPNAVPTRLQINRSLADLFFTEGRYSDAAANFEAIYATSKNTADGPMDGFTLAEAKALRDLTATSADALVTAYNALNANQKAENKSAIVASLLKLGKIEQALDFAGAAESDDANLNLDLAKAARLKSDFSKAEAIASHVVASTTATAEQKSNAQEELAQIMLVQGNAEKADEWARKAVESYSKNFEAYETIGRVYLKKADAKSAMDAANKSTGINPYFAKAYLLLGDAQQSAGLMKEASLSYRKASELYPGLLEAHKSLLQTLQKLSLKEEARKEAEQIAQMEKQH
jgi:tetratricopeptide (TPR) repeat protein